MGAAENKNMVVEFFRRGVDSAAGAELLAAGFRLWVPTSLAAVMTGGRTSFAGSEGLQATERVDCAAYREGSRKSKVVYIIAEGDWVVICFDMTATTYDDDEYLNRYLFSVRCADGRIAEMWEMTDTKHWMDVVAGTPNKLAGIKARLEAATAKCAPDN